LLVANDDSLLQRLVSFAVKPGPKVLAILLDLANEQRLFINSLIFFWRYSRALAFHPCNLAIHFSNPSDRIRIGIGSELSFTAEITAFSDVSSSLLIVLASE
jgi:hypothetical protein